MKLMKAAGIKLVHALISLEIQLARGAENKIKKSTRTLLSGKNWKSIGFSGMPMQKLLQNGQNYPKLAGKSYILSNQKREFEPGFHTKVLDFYHRDDFLTAVPGKQNVKKNTKIHIQKRVWMITWAFAPKNNRWKHWFEIFVYNICTNESFLFCTW